VEEKEQARSLLALFVIELDKMVCAQTAPHLFEKGYVYLKLVARWTELRAGDQT
jgi:hypothetical protein